MAEQLAVLRASGRRLAPYGVTGPSMDGWTAVPPEALAPLAVGTRAPGCCLAWSDWPTVTVYGAGGEVVHLVGDVEPERAEQAAALLGHPGAGPVLHRALTVDSPFYDTAARVADVCRAVGVPLALLTEVGPVDGATPEVAADVGFVLLRLDPATAAAESPLTRQSAWVVPMGTAWSTLVWDGTGPRNPLPANAMTLSQGHHGSIALAAWWSSDRAGLFLARAGRAVAAHEWSPRFDLGIEHTAAAGRALATAFRVPGRALDATTVLRREAAEPVRALVDLLTVLAVPTVLVGLSQDELVAAARSAPGAAHAPRLSPLRAVVHAVRESPATTVVDRAVRERPRWYRILNVVIAAFMALATVVLYLNWRWGVISWWWVVLGAVTAVSYAVAGRPGRRRPP